MCCSLHHYHVDVIVLKGYPGWLFLQACGPSMGYSSLVWRIPQISVQWGLAGVAAAAFIAIYIGLF